VEAPHALPPSLPPSPTPTYLRRVITRRPEVRSRARHPQNLIFLPGAIHDSDANLGGGRVGDVVERDFFVPGGGNVVHLREGGREGGRAVSVLSTSFSCQSVTTTKQQRRTLTELSSRFPSNVKTTRQLLIPRISGPCSCVCVCVCG